MNDAVALYIFVFDQMRRIFLTLDAIYALCLICVNHQYENVIVYPQIFLHLTFFQKFSLN